MEGKEIYQSDKQDSDTQKQRGEIHPPFLTDSGKKQSPFSAKNWLPLILTHPICLSCLKYWNGPIWA